VFFELFPFFSPRFYAIAAIMAALAVVFPTFFAVFRVFLHFTACFAIAEKEWLR
jgi:hypothetical protein